MKPIDEVLGDGAKKLQANTGSLKDAWAKNKPSKAVLSFMTGLWIVEAIFTGAIYISGGWLRIFTGLPVGTLVALIPFIGGFALIQIWNNRAVVKSWAMDGKTVDQAASKQVLKYLAFFLLPAVAMLFCIGNIHFYLVASAIIAYMTTEEQKKAAGNAPPTPAP